MYFEGDSLGDIEMILKIYEIILAVDENFYN